MNRRFANAASLDGGESRGSTRIDRRGECPKPTSVGDKDVPTQSMQAKSKVTKRGNICLRWELDHHVGNARGYIDAKTISLRVVNRGTWTHTPLRKGNDRVSV